MDNLIMTFVNVAQFVYLGMAIMAGRDYISSTRILDLLVFDFTIFEAFFLKP